MPPSAKPPAAARVTVHTTPSQELVQQASKAAEITDRRGRKFKLVKPSVLAQYRIVKVVGADTAANQTYMMMIMPLLFVQEIDGETVMFPNSELELEALIQRLDDDGVEAVALGVQENWGNQDPEADKAAIKK